MWSAGWARRLIWVAGLHRNTDYPHLHLIIQRAFIEGDTGRLRRLGRLPERMLPGKGGPEGGPDPGAIGRAFESALDRRLERIRRSDLAGRPLLSDDRAATEFSAPRRTPAANSDRLAESLMRDHPSPAGRELILEILARDGEGKEIGLSLAETLRPRDLDDPDYAPPHELADRLGAASRELRDLYERGAWLKGDTLLLPAEPHEVGEPHEDVRANLGRRAAQRIPDPAKAREFAGLARAIAGEGADARAERAVYNYYLGQAAGGPGAVERALGEMRALAAALAPLETRESVERHLTSASFNEARQGQGSASDGGDDSESALHGRLVYKMAARRVDLGDEPPRLPTGLSDTFKAHLVGKVLAAVDRAIESGAGARDVAAGVTAEGGALRLRHHLDYVSAHAGLGAPGRNDGREGRSDGRDVGIGVVRVNLAGAGGAWKEVRDLGAYRQLLLAARERRVGLSARTSAGGTDYAAAAEEEWVRVRRFVGDYVEARLRDPETRELNRSAEFRRAYARLNGARDERELSLAAAAILRENVALCEDRGPDRPRPLDARQRVLLFFGHSPRHFTPAMRRLKLDWGLSRAERERKVTGLTKGREEPSQNLSLLLEELGARGSRRAVAHFQASILSGDRMAVKGPRDLQDLYLRLAPHERTYLYLQVLDRRASLGRDHLHGGIPAAGREREDVFTRQATEFSRTKGQSVHDCGETLVRMHSITGHDAASAGELAGVILRPEVGDRGRQGNGSPEGDRGQRGNEDSQTRSDKRASMVFER